jgi:hypothetical protein
MKTYDDFVTFKYFTIFMNSAIAKKTKKRMRKQGIKILLIILVLVVLFIAARFLFYDQIFQTKTRNDITGNTLIEVSCDEQKDYMSCINCCQDKANQKTGSESYGKPDWNTIYNDCWMNSCKDKEQKLP